MTRPPQGSLSNNTNTGEATPSGVEANWHASFNRSIAQLSFSFQGAELYAEVEPATIEDKKQMFLSEGTLSPEQRRQNVDVRLLGAAVAIARKYKMERIFGYATSEHTISAIGKLFIRRNIEFQHPGPDGEIIELPITVDQVMQSLKMSGANNAGKIGDEGENTHGCFSYSVSLRNVRLRREVKVEKPTEINQVKEVGRKSSFF